ncbi:MAG: hypothetical protein SGCHY_000775 [Lobulomycetales sp.]
MRFAILVTICWAYAVLGATRLTPSEKKEHLPALVAAGWVLPVEGEERLERRFVFSDFNEAFGGFMTSVAAQADMMDHHPEWCNVYNRVDVTLTTHDVGGLSILDVRLAQFMTKFTRSILLD